jgi:hypothetical protein
MPFSSLQCYRVRDVISEMQTNNKSKLTPMRCLPSRRTIKDVDQLFNGLALPINRQERQRNDLEPERGGRPPPSAACYVSSATSSLPLVAVSTNPRPPMGVRPLLRPLRPGLCRPVLPVSGWGLSLVLFFYPPTGLPEIVVL